MSLQVEKLEKNMAKLTIEVSADELEKALQFLKEKEIPVTKGTFFGVLNRLKKDVKEPVYQKRIKPKI